LAPTFDDYDCHANTGGEAEAETCIVLGVLALVVGGSQYITGENFSWGFYLLATLCFPFVYKWLK